MFAQFAWSKALDELLLQAVAKHADDWDQVAAELGENVTAEECMHRFCELPLNPQGGFAGEEEKQELSAAELLEAADVTGNTEAVQAACGAAWDVLRRDLEGAEPSQVGDMVAKAAAQAAAAGLTGAAAKLASAKARQTLNHMVDDYLAARLQSLEEKVSAAGANLLQCLSRVQYFFTHLVACWMRFHNRPKRWRRWRSWSIWRAKN